MNKENHGGYVCCFCGEDIQDEVIAITTHFDYPTDKTRPQQQIFSDRNCFHENIFLKLNWRVTDEPGFTEYPDKK